MKVTLPTTPPANLDALITRLLTCTLAPDLKPLAEGATHIKPLLERSPKVADTLVKGK